MLTEGRSHCFSLSRVVFFPVAVVALFMSVGVCDADVPPGTEYYYVIPSESILLPIPQTHQRTLDKHDNIRPKNQKIVRSTYKP